MKYTVVATESVEASLAELYLSASNPHAITDAANWIESRLRNDPLGNVTSVDDLYFLRRDPLVALCTISVDDRLVKIVEIHRVDEH